jgi:hypothetical protein
MKTLNLICRTLFLAGLLFAFCIPSARAQYEDGSLIGTIHDATGAAVPNAAITATNINTGNVIKVTANASGDYEIPSLRVGVYNIEASAPTFAPAEAKTSLSRLPDANASTSPSRLAVRTQPPSKSAMYPCKSRPRPASADNRFRNIRPNPCRW